MSLKTIKTDTGMVSLQVRGQWLFLPRANGGADVLDLADGNVERIAKTIAEYIEDCFIDSVAGDPYAVDQPDLFLYLANK